MLRLMKRMKFLRGLFPGWHQEEKEFRSWYQGLVDRFKFEDSDEYHRYVQALLLPDSVRGYREVIHHKMRAAYEKADCILSGKDVKADADGQLRGEFPKEAEDFRPVGAD